MRRTTIGLFALAVMAAGCSDYDTPTSPLRPEGDPILPQLTVMPADACGATAYTTNLDFDKGTLTAVNHDTPDQLQLNGPGAPFKFIWVAASGRGTIVKIDTETGAVLGEYWSSPSGMPKNPSRTTVDANGNVWAGNRDQGGTGSVVKIGLLENGQCVDRDGDGAIFTSTGLGDIKDWPAGTDGAGGADARVEDADDECILVFQRTPNAPNVRHVSVGPDNNVWIGGYPGGPMFHQLAQTTGQILKSFSPPGCGR